MADTCIIHYQHPSKKGILIDHVDISSGGPATAVPHFLRLKTLAAVASFWLLYS